MNEVRHWSMVLGLKKTGDVLARSDLCGTHRSISPRPPVVLGGLLDAMTGTPCADRDGRHPGLGHACARHRDGVP